MQALGSGGRENRDESQLPGARIETIDERARVVFENDYTRVRSPRESQEAGEQCRSEPHAAEYSTQPLTAHEGRAMLHP